MTRIQQHTAATITATFSVDGDATDPTPDTAWVTVTDALGTVLDTDTGTEAGEGAYTYTLSPEMTATLGPLALTWTATVGGIEQTLTTRVEIVGGFYFTIAEFYAHNPDLAADGDNPKTPARVAEVRALAEESIEDACGVAFVPRGSSETFEGAQVIIDRPRLRRITAATVDGDTLDVTGTVVDSGRGYRTGGWPAGSLTVLTEHGYDQPPGRVKQAAMILTRVWLIDGPITKRATQMPTEDGGTINLATPGVFGATFGIPEVDAVIHQYEWPTAQVGSIRLSQPARSGSRLDFADYR